MKCLAFRLPESAENGNQAVAKESRTARKQPSGNPLATFGPLVFF